MILRFLALASAAAMLIGCDARTDASADAPAPAGTAADSVGEPRPGGPPVAAAPAPRVAISGEYRVAGVDDGDINLPHGITASIGEDRIDVSSQCVEMAWSYRLAWRKTSPKLR